jgi:hypothetical protein
MAGSDKNRVRSRRPGVVDRGWSSTGRVLGGRTIEMSGDAVCGLHRARGARVSWLSLKTKVNGLSVVWLQNHWDGLSVV